MEHERHRRVHTILQYDLFLSQFNSIHTSHSLPLKYCPLIYFYFFEVLSSLQVPRPTILYVFLSTEYMLPVQLSPFFLDLIASAALDDKYKLRR
jgi:hypothetical protein